MAEEIAQDTFVKYFNTYAEKPLEEAEKILFRIAKNKVKDYYRQNNRRGEIFEDYLRCLSFFDFNYHDFVERELFAKDKIEAIKKAIEDEEIQLNELETLVYEATFEQNVPFKSNMEIAEVSGIKKDKMVSAKKTFLRKIKKYFKKGNCFNLI